MLCCRRSWRWWKRGSRKVTGAKKLWLETTPEGATLNHNYAQLVGMAESGPRPHTDSRKLCRYAAVIYLTPEPEPEAAPRFIASASATAQLGGNICSPPHANLREALGVTGLPLDAWVEETRVDNKFNRMLLYKREPGPLGQQLFRLRPAEKRMTAVFFWMA